MLVCSLIAACCADWQPDCRVLRLSCRAGLQALAMVRLAQAAQAILACMVRPPQHSRQDTAQDKTPLHSPTATPHRPPLGRLGSSLPDMVEHRSVLKQPSVLLCMCLPFFRCSCYVINLSLIRKFVMLNSALTVHAVSVNSTNYHQSQQCLAALTFSHPGNQYGSTINLHHAMNSSFGRLLLCKIVGCNLAYQNVSAGWI